MKIWRVIKNIRIKSLSLLKNLFVLEICLAVKIMTDDYLFAE
jgi:hypothetical protein